MPHLNYNERNGLNMCIPTVDRIRTRMNQGSIEKHDQAVCIDIIKKYLDLSFSLSGNIQIKHMIRVFKLLQTPRCFSIIRRSTTFRNVIIAKIQELIQGLINVKGDIELTLRLKLASEFKKLRTKVNSSGPYTDLRLDTMPTLTFQ